MDLLSIGNEIASSSGGSCYEYEIDEQNKTVIFNCVEGVLFCEEKSFDELKTEYNFDVNKNNK